MTKFNLFHIPHRDSLNTKKKARRQWDFLCALTGVIILVSVLFCLNQEFELNQSNSQGFLLWFLLFCAYPFLWLISVFNIIFGIDGPGMMDFITSNGYQAVALGIINFSALLAIWLLVRFWFLRAFGSKWVKVCSVLMMTYASWGIFQLSLYLMVILWNNSGFEAFHTQKSEPLPAMTVVPESAIKIESQQQIIKSEKAQ